MQKRKWFLLSILKCCRNFLLNHSLSCILKCMLLPCAFLQLAQMDRGPVHGCTSQSGWIAGNAGISWQGKAGRRNMAAVAAHACRIQSSSFLAWTQQKSCHRSEEAYDGQVACGRGGHFLKFNLVPGCLCCMQWIGGG